MTGEDPAHQQFLSALEAIDAAAGENLSRAEEIRSRVRWLQEQIATDRPLVDIVKEEPRPLIVELATTNIQTLQSIGVQLRIAEAALLHSEGMTMSAIGELFGVTRQRVSALLNQTTSSA